MLVARSRSDIGEDRARRRGGEARRRPTGKTQNDTNIETKRMNNIKTHTIDTNNQHMYVGCAGFLCTSYLCRLKSPKETILSLKFTHRLIDFNRIDCRPQGAFIVSPVPPPPCPSSCLCSLPFVSLLFCWSLFLPFCWLRLSRSRSPHLPIGIGPHHTPSRSTDISDTT